MVKPDIRPGSRVVALLAFARRLDVRHRLSGCAHSIMTGRALVWQRRELTTRVTGFARDGAVAPFQCEAGRQMIKCGYRIGRRRGSDGRGHIQ